MRKSVTTTATRAHIDRMVKRIVKKFHPERVILFGSHVRGDAGPDSDVDLLVVTNFEGTARDKDLEIRHALHDFLIPVDVIVTSPEDSPGERTSSGKRKCLANPVTLIGGVRRRLPSSRWLRTWCRVGQARCR